MYNHNDCSATFQAKPITQSDPNCAEFSVRHSGMLPEMEKFWCVFNPSISLQESTRTGLRRDSTRASDSIPVNARTPTTRTRLLSSRRDSIPVNARRRRRRTAAG